MHSGKREKDRPEGRPFITDFRNGGEHQLTPSP
jgi:hypothetical protein